MVCYAAINIWNVVIKKVLVRECEADVWTGDFSICSECHCNVSRGYCKVNLDLKESEIGLVLIFSFMRGWPGFHHLDRPHYLSVSFPMMRLHSCIDPLLLLSLSLSLHKIRGEPKVGCRNGTKRRIGKKPSILLERQWEHFLVWWIEHRFHGQKTWVWVLAPYLPAILHFFEHQLPYP